MISNAQISDDAEFDCQVLQTPTTEHLQSRPAQVTVFREYSVASLCVPAL